MVNSGTIAQRASKNAKLNPWWLIVGTAPETVASTEPHWGQGHYVNKCTRNLLAMAWLNRSNRSNGDHNWKIYIMSAGGNREQLPPSVFTASHKKRYLSFPLKTLMS